MQNKIDLKKSFKSHNFNNLNDYCMENITTRQSYFFIWTILSLIHHLFCMKHMRHEVKTFIYVFSDCLHHIFKQHISFFSSACSFLFSTSYSLVQLQWTIQGQSEDSTLWIINCMMDKHFEWGRLKERIPSHSCVWVILAITAVWILTKSIFLTCVSFLCLGLAKTIQLQPCYSGKTCILYS